MDKVAELDTDRQDIIMDCLAVRQGDIQNALLEEKCAVSGPILEAFDWKIKARDMHLKRMLYLLNDSLTLVIEIANLAYNPKAHHHCHCT
jgi:hypothetical protein